VASILLPSWPGPRSATPFQISFSEQQEAFLGGPDVTILRPGSRMGVAVTLPPMSDAIARPWITRLLVAESDDVILDWPQPGFGNTVAGSLTVRTSALANSFALPVAGKSGGSFQEGQFVNVIRNARRYLHIIRDPSDQANPGIYPALRTALSGGEAIDAATPKIEGTVKGNRREWTVDVAGTVGLSFEVWEAE
jgi:hypothetical protein